MAEGASAPASGPPEPPASKAERATPHHACGFISCPPLPGSTTHRASDAPLLPAPPAPTLTIGAAGRRGYGPPREGALDDSCLVRGGGARRGMCEHSGR